MWNVIGVFWVTFLYSKTETVSTMAAPVRTRLAVVRQANLDPDVPLGHVRGDFHYSDKGGLHLDRQAVAVSGRVVADPSRIGL